MELILEVLGNDLMRNCFGFLNFSFGFFFFLLFFFFTLNYFFLSLLVGLCVYVDGISVFGGFVSVFLMNWVCSKIEMKRLYGCMQGV